MFLPSEVSLKCSKDVFHGIRLHSAHHKKKTNDGMPSTFTPVFIFTQHFHTFAKHVFLCRLKDIQKWKSWSELWWTSLQWRAICYCCCVCVKHWPRGRRSVLSAVYSDGFTLVCMSSHLFIYYLLVENVFIFLTVLWNHGSSFLLTAIK